MKHAVPFHPFAVLALFVAVSLAAKKWDHRDAVGDRVIKKLREKWLQDIADVEVGRLTDKNFGEVFRPSFPRSDLTHWPRDGAYGEPKPGSDPLFDGGNDDYYSGHTYDDYGKDSEHYDEWRGRGETREKHKHAVFPKTNWEPWQQMRRP